MGSMEAFSGGFVGSPGGRGHSIPMTGSMGRGRIFTLHEWLIFMVFMYSKYTIYTHGSESWVLNEFITCAIYFSDPRELRPPGK